MLPRFGVSCLPPFLPFFVPLFFGSSLSLAVGFLSTRGAPPIPNMPLRAAVASFTSSSDGLLILVLNSLLTELFCSTYMLWLLLVLCVNCSMYFKNCTRWWLEGRSHYTKMKLYKSQSQQEQFREICGHNRGKRNDLGMQNTQTLLSVES